MAFVWQPELRQGRSKRRLGFSIWIHREMLTSLINRKERIWVMRDPRDSGRRQLSLQRVNQMGPCVLSVTKTNIIEYEMVMLGCVSAG